MSQNNYGAVNHASAIIHVPVHVQYMYVYNVQCTVVYMTVC